MVSCKFCLNLNHAVGCRVLERIKSCLLNSVYRKGKKLKLLCKKKV